MTKLRNPAVDAGVHAVMSPLPAWSRREALGLGGAAMLAVVSSPFWPEPVRASSAHDPAIGTLATVARDMFPHRAVPESVFVKFAESQLSAPDPAVRQSMRTGVDDLQRRAGGDYRQLESSARIRLLGSLAGTPFFGSVRFAALVALYSDPSVVRRFGYEGASWEEGGYLTRGYDDLRWLPDPE
jgi:hypothetical protein